MEIDIEVPAVDPAVRVDYCCGGEVWCERSRRIVALVGEELVTHFAGIRDIDAICSNSDEIAEDSSYVDL